MADQPANTEWVITKHVRFPIAGDEVIGHYPTLEDAQVAMTQLLAQPQWFCRYAIEHRNKEK